MNKLHLIGNLVRDPESRTTSAGKTVCNFTVAVNRRNKSGKEGQPEADFFRVAAWEKLADSCQKYLAKGRKVAVVGPVSASIYTPDGGEARAQMEVMAQEVEFLGARENGTSGEHSTAQAPVAVAVDEGELPF